MADKQQTQPNKEPKILSLDEIMAARDIEERVVPVPEWGGAVRIRGLSKAQQSRLRSQAKVDGQPDPDRMEVLMLAASLVEPAVTVEQAEALREKAATAVERILREVVDINGWGEQVQKEALKSFLAGDSGSA